MESVMVIQGRQIGEQDIELVRGLLESHLDWNRTRVSRELCARWAWHNAKGRPKDMACRIHVAVKDVYLYPLVADFRRELSA